MRVMTNEEALYHLGRNPRDAVALQALRRNNSSIFYTIVHYWFNGNAPTLVFDSVIRTCAENARYFNPLVTPASQWLGQIAERECHALHTRSSRFSL